MNITVYGINVRPQWCLICLFIFVPTKHDHLGVLCVHQISSEPPTCVSHTADTVIHSILYVFLHAFRLSDAGPVLFETQSVNLGHRVMKNRCEYGFKDEKVQSVLIIT